MAARFVLDTNIYGKIIEDAIEHELVEKLDVMSNEFIVYGMKVIRDELRRTARASRHKGYSLRIALLQLYDHIVKDHVLQASPLTASLAKIYFKKYKDLGGSKTWKEIRNDFIIVAQATISRLDVVVSEDNRTMLSKAAMESYYRVNKENNFITPNFIDYKRFKNRFI